MNYQILLLLLCACCGGANKTVVADSGIACAANQQFSDCPTNCPASCANRNPMCNRACAKPGCVCVSGFVLNGNGTCIKEAECRSDNNSTSGSGAPTNKCSANQQFSDCPTNCPSSCANRNPICNRACGKPACVCLSGFVLNGNGTCIKEADCPSDNNSTSGSGGPNKNCSANEVYDGCFHGCENTCANRLVACTLQCGPGGCRCDTGFLRNAAGKCVKPSACPQVLPITPEPKVCAKNETYDQCFHGCENTCANRNTACTEQCGPGGCRCSNGFLRNASGVCVATQDCGGTTCASNELYRECASRCEPSCSKPEPFCTDDCAPGGCQCQPGLLRGPNGLCIEASACNSTLPKCSANETLNECSSKCAEKKCNRELKMACPAVCGPPACECSTGFSRSLEGKCIKNEECPPKTGGHDPPACGANETLNDCSSPCSEKKCGGKPDMPCPAVCGPPACQCSKGFFRSRDGKCVKDEECEPETGGPDPLPCSANETFSQCSNHCAEKKCGALDNKPMCTKMCGLPGCECKEGYARTANNTCVLVKDCTTPKCGANESLNNCPNSCSEPACGDGGAQWCAGLMFCDAPQCRCDEGFVRNGTNGGCIKRDQCKEKDCPIGEVWKNCSNSCMEPLCDKRLQRKCMQMCGPGACECAPGYSRSGPKCVLDELCPKFDDSNSTCGANQVHTDCTTTCEPKCGDEDQVGRLCVASCGPPGCQCAESFRRDPTTGECVVPEKCASETCGPNESMAPCGNACMERKCHENGTRACTRECQPPACRCAAGFVRDVATKQCVKEEECSKDVCAGHDCMGGICVPEAVTCVKAPCHPVPTCKPSCKTMKCAGGCVEDETGGHCKPVEPADPCSNHTCPDGQRCYPRDVQCIRAPCPSQPTCLNVTTCETTECASGFVCIQGDVSAECVPRLNCTTVKCKGGKVCVDSPTSFPKCVDAACANMTCAEGEMCRLQDVYCIKAPCEPVAQCMPKSTCAATTCSVGSTCIDGENGAECVQGPNGPTCATTLCITGTNCIMGANGPECVKEPLLGGSCSSIRCTGGKVCYMDASGPKCAEDKCALVDCRGKCELRAVTCVRAPCEPEAVCIPPTNSGCMTMKCSAGFECKDLPEGSKCVSTTDVCANHTCANGEECFPQEVQCFVAPCLPIPSCRPSKPSITCANTLCAAGTHCIMESLRCIKAPCPERPVCVPNESSCAVTECSEGFTCVESANGPNCVKTNSSLCDVGEVYTECAPACEETCHGIPKCRVPMAAVCRPGCVCEKGRFRNVRGHCAPGNKCWRSAGCRAHETWSKCVGCEPTCDEPLRSEQNCTVKCRSGCGCKAGFIRDSDGECVEEGECDVDDYDNSEEEDDSTPTSNGTSRASARKVRSPTEVINPLSFIFATGVQDNRPMMKFREPEGNEPKVERIN